MDANNAERSCATGEMRREPARHRAHCALIDMSAARHGLVCDHSVCEHHAVGNAQPRTVMGAGVVALRKRERVRLELAGITSWRHRDLKVILIHNAQVLGQALGQEQPEISGRLEGRLEVRV